MRRWLRGWFSLATAPLRERRHQQRRTLNLKVRCRRSATHLQGMLLELSEAGLRVQLSTQVSPGERLEVAENTGPASLAGRSVTCHVVWCVRREGAFLVGLRCQAGLYGSWLSGHLSRERAFRRRQHRRFALHAPAQVAQADGLVGLGVLLDVGLGGARVRVAARPSVGQLVHLRVEGMTLVASVVGCTLDWEQGQATLNLRFLKGQPALRPLRRLVARAA